MALSRWLFVFLTAGLPGCGGGDAAGDDPFGPSVGWPTGFPARALAVLDGDAARVALAFQLEDQVGLLDASDGELVPWAAAVGASPIALAALDADGDGRRELATANAGDATLTLLSGSDDGLVILTTGSLSLRPKHVHGADLDGDGRDEALVTVGLEGEAGAGLEVLRAEGDALVLVAPRWSIGGAFAATSGDLDGDGDLDVVAVLPSGDGVAWATNDGAGRLDEVGRAVACTAPRAAAAIGDRIAVACRDGLAVVRVADGAVDRVTTSGNLYDLAAGDFDGDGRADVAAVDLAADEVLVFLGRESGGLSSPTRHPVGADPIALVAADLGGDGDLDLVISAFGSRTIDVLENQRSHPERISP